MKHNDNLRLLRILLQSQRRVIMITIGIIGGVVLLLYGMYTYREARIRRDLMESDFENTSKDPALEERVASIASNFDCASCDTCKGMPLATCTCKSAKAERNLIRREIVIHESDSVVIQHVRLHFGGLHVAQNNNMWAPQGK